MSARKALARQQENLGLQLKRSRFFGAPQNKYQSHRYSSLGVNYSYSNKAPEWQALLNSNGLFTFNERGPNQRYLAVPQAFVRYDWQENFDITVGRRTDLWSAFDREWGLGLWQPYVRWDYLNPKVQGLSGLFFDYTSGASRFTLFASGFFLPDQGPQLEVENGQFYSSNRWFFAPHSRLTALEKSSDIHYRLDWPNGEELAFHPSFGVKGIWGDVTDDGMWVRSAYAYKPQNQLFIAIDGAHSHHLAQGSNFKTRPTVHPTVVYHHVSTVETGWSSNETSTWLSMSGDFPVAPDIPEDWEKTELGTTYFGGAWLEHQVRAGFLPTLTVQWSYLRSWKPFQTSSKSVVSNQVESSLERFPYKEVVSVEGSTDLWTKGLRNLAVNVRYLYSLADASALLSADLNYRTNQNLKWWVGADILGAGDAKAGPGQSLMSRYRSNDRVMGGIQYDF